MGVQVLEYGVTPETHRLAVIWKLREDAKDVRAIVLQIAQDSTFTTEVRLCLVPASITRLDLDVGDKVRWFFRMGAAIGTVDAGQVVWSDVYGPIPVSTEKPVLAESVTDLSGILLHAIPSGVRLVYPADTAGSYVFSELATDARFPYSSTRWSYARLPPASAAPSMDVGGILAAPDRMYYVRLHRVPCPELDLGAKTLRQLTRIATFTDVKPAALMRGADSSDHTAHAASAAIVNDIKSSGRPMKFPTHADYMRYMAALQKF
jgi:hypothetical protein